MPTPPFATSSSTPTTAQPSHCVRAGQRRAAGPPAARPRIATGNMISPATRFRVAAISSGGIVSTATLMAR